MKTYLSIRVLLQVVTGLMTLALVTIFAIDAVRALEEQEQARRVPAIVEISTDLFTAVQSLRVERGTVNAALATAEIIDPDSQSEIAAVRLRSGKALESALARLTDVSADGVGPAIGGIRDSRAAFDLLRQEVDAALQKPKDVRPRNLGANWIAANGTLIGAIDRLSSQLESELSQDDAFIADMIRVKQIVWSMRSDSGDERLLVREAMVRGEKLSDADRRQLAVLAGRIEGAWKLIKDKAELTTTPRKLKGAIEEADRLYFNEFRTLRDTVVEELEAGRPVQISPREWLTVSTPGRQSALNVAIAAFEIASAHAVEQFAAAKSEFYFALSFMAFFSVIGVLTMWYVFKGVAQPISKITGTMHRVAEGDLKCSIPFEHRADEIGLLSRALRVFRDNAIERQQLYLEKLSAESANRAKSEFLANMSHELRTPLNAVIGFSEIIKNASFGPNSERYREYGADIFNSGTHLLGLINEILDLSKLEAGQFELYEEDVDLDIAIRASKRLVEPQAANARIQLFETIGGTLPLIRADDRRIRQVLINILANAVKFTPHGGQVRVARFVRDGELVIAISDTGIGMAPDDIPKALELFGQVDSKISRKYAGTGLGLPLAKHLVELHGGRLTIESELNVGTTVTITLPSSRIVAQPAGQPPLKAMG